MSKRFFGTKGFLKKMASNYAMYQAAVKYCRNVPGHFYSPIVNVDEVLAKGDSIWDKSRPVHSISLDVSKQLDQLKEFERYYVELPFPEQPTSGFRYYFNNEYYSYTDGIVLYSFLRHFKPGQIIEIGSGFSSALMLDTRDRFALDTQLSFIEPFPKRLHSLLRPEDRMRTEIVEDKLQNVPLSFFRKLRKGDILFVDSTHVCKTGSDVNYILFEILPELQSGVMIHVHDIFDSFEYPKAWITQKRSWNEIYLWRAFLMDNPNYEIILFSNFLHSRKPEAFKNMELCYRDGGSNFWLRKL